jgi:hypothetical protein
VEPGAIDPNIRVGYKGVTETNTLAYYTTVLIAVGKESFLEYNWPVLET